MLTMKFIGSAAARRTNDESGAFIILAIVLLFVILFIGSLVVDLLLIERVGATLQRTADAAALNGKIYLDKESPSAGTRLEWLLAKRAVFSFLRDNQVTFGGDDVRRANYLPSGKGILDVHEEQQSPYSYTEYEFKNLLVRIERGLWWYDSVVAPRGKFNSLETADGLCPTLPAQAQSHCRRENPNYTGANAVQISIRLKAGPVLLAAAAFGVRALRNVQRQAIAGPR